MNYVNENDEYLELQPPHRKGPLTTPLGRFIDNLSYESLIGMVFIVLACSTTYFYVATQFDHGIATSAGNKADSIWDSLYFSVVTFTTLGYGDISPHGMGRIVAGLVVFSGLCLVALFVGKVASERQYSMLLLLHTSDCQRRLREFSNNLHDATKAISLSIGANDLEGLKQCTKDLVGLLEAIFNYMIFHLNQTKLADFGNDSALIDLYKKLQVVQLSCAEAFKSKIADEIIGNRCLAMTKRISNFEKLLAAFQNKSRTANTSILDRISSRFKRQINQTDVSIGGMPMLVQANELNEWARSNVSNWLQCKVHCLLPPGPRANWTQHQHKKVAQELEISNNLAQICIRNLITSGKVK